MKPIKTMRFLRALALNRVRPSVPFLRILPTDLCNLDCAYCWQRSADRHFMSMDDFVACLDAARRLDVGLVSFLGGEPTLWPHLEEAVALCTRYGIATDMTTNGSRLSKARLERLRGAGLDLLNISIDGLERAPGNRKAALAKPGLADAIAEIIADGRMRIRGNAVVGRHNLDGIGPLLALAGEIGMPFSIGYAVPRSAEEFDPGIHFSVDDPEGIAAVCACVESARSAGTRIIDPMAYFRGYDRYLARERFWVCNYATRRGWINVDPYGYVRDCTKKMNRIDIRFADMTRADVTPLRERLALGVEECNRDCYSNCAFDGAWFARHKFRFLTSGLAWPA